MVTLDHLPLNTSRQPGPLGKYASAETLLHADTAEEAERQPGAGGPDSLGHHRPSPAQRGLRATRQPQPSNPHTSHFPSPCPFHRWVQSSTPPQGSSPQPHSQPEFISTPPALEQPGGPNHLGAGGGGQLRPYMVWKGASDSFDDLYSQPQTCQPVSPKRLPSALWGAFGSLSSKAPVPWPWGHCAFWFSSRPHHASRRLPAGLPGSQVCPLPFVPASTATSPP